MKTIEEKAKAYDESVERAKQIAAQGGASRYLVTQIFPELKESEDERINKAIFKALSKKEARDVLLAEGVQVSDALAYLERQKEQKPASFNEPYNPDEYDVVMEGNATSLKRKEQKPITGNGISEQTKINKTVYKFTPEEWKKALDEQLPKEQKPAWSEEDEDKIMSIKNLITTGKFADTNTIRIIWDMLESLRPQPKQEPTPVIVGAASYETLSDTLAIGFMDYLDRNKTEGKMCLSGWECDDIVKAFRKQDWERIERYRDKYLLSKND